MNQDSGIKSGKSLSNPENPDSEAVVSDTGNTCPGIPVKKHFVNCSDLFAGDR